MVLGHEPRQTTSNLGHLNKPSIQVTFFYICVFTSNPAQQNFFFFLHLLFYFIYLKKNVSLLLMYHFIKSHFSCAGIDSWAQQTLLLHYNQLQEK